MPAAFILSATLLLSCYKPNYHLVDSFSFVEWSPRTRLPDSPSHPRFGSSSTTTTTTLRTRQLFLAESSSDRENTEEKESWSRRASSSPLKVRNRVRAVLKRARDRTGISNSSEDEDVASQQQQKQQQRDTIVAEPEKNAFSMTEKMNGTPDLVNGSLLKYLQPTIAPQVENGFESPRPESFNTENESIPAIQTNMEKEPVAPNAQNVVANESVASSSSTTMSAATTPCATSKVEPLPFSLPKLTEDQKRRLLLGERIQEQSKMGNEGSGYVVVDVKAPPYVVWECLLDFESYPETIPTVRDMKLFTSTHLKEGYHAELPVVGGAGRATRHYGTPSVTRAAFVLSKFRLNIAAIHTYRPHPDGDYMIFTLDPSCTNVVLQNAKGIWYTQACPEGREVRWKDSLLVFGT